MWLSKAWTMLTQMTTRQHLTSHQQLRLMLPSRRGGRAPAHDRRVNATGRDHPLHQAVAPVIRAAAGHQTCPQAVAAVAVGAGAGTARNASTKMRSTNPGSAARAAAASTSTKRSPANRHPRPRSTKRIRWGVGTAMMWRLCCSVLQFSACAAEIQEIGRAQEQQW